MKIVYFVALCVLSAPAGAAPVEVSDQARGRIIPVEIYDPEGASNCAASDRCPVAIISAGYGVSHTRYRFIAQAYLELGYFVAAVRHELPGDPPLSVSGDLYETRKENWRRGAESLRVVRGTLAERFPRFNFGEVTLIGHSNGGDISAWFASHEPGAVKALVTLDNRRMPLPREQGLPVLSIRADEFPADKGVIPGSEEQIAFNMCIVRIPNALHNDMSDDGPPWLKRKISQIIRAFGAEQSSCPEPGAVGGLMHTDEHVLVGD